ncbi:MAG: segregation and condensation protein A [Acidimicrobiales bacterium]
MSSYEVSTPVYAGPLDLLLALINASQVDLWEVSITDLLVAYLAEAAQPEHLDLESATEVLMVASTLIQLKCRRLLPGPDDVDLDEELSPWEERDLLLTRMLECRTFAQAGRSLEDLAGRAALSAPRVAGLEEAFVGLAPDLLSGLSPVDLLGAFLRVSAARPVPQVDASHMAPPTMSVDEVATLLSGELSGLGRATFRYLTRNAQTRADVVVAFLAVLELYKDGMVELDQVETFGELRVAWLVSATRPTLVGAR